MGEVQTRYGACNLCEAICGLEFKIQDGRILSVRGDEAGAGWREALSCSN